MNKINHISYYYVVKPNRNLKNEKEHTPCPSQEGNDQDMLLFHSLHFFVILFVAFCYVMSSSFK